MKQASANFDTILWSTCNPSCDGREGGRGPHLVRLARLSSSLRQRWRCVVAPPPLAPRTAVVFLSIASAIATTLRSMGWFWTLVARSNAVAGPIVMLLYPLYASVMAIESPFKEDDQQWLTYWVLYSFVSLLEMAAAPVFAWIPLYSTIKLAVAAWLVLPQFRGGVILYEKFVRPHFYAALGGSDDRSSLSSGQRKWLGSIKPETRTAVAKYVQVKGPEAFEKLVTSELVKSIAQKPRVAENPHTE